MTVLLLNSEKYKTGKEKEFSALVGQEKLSKLCIYVKGLKIEVGPNDFLKKVSFCRTCIKEPRKLCAPSSNLNTAFKLIKDIQKKYKTREAEEKELADLVVQDKLSK